MTSTHLSRDVLRLFGQHKRTLAITACLSIAVIVLVSNGRPNEFNRPPLHDNLACPVPLRSNHSKVATYRFPEATKYSYLFTGPGYSSNVSMPTVPAFVTAFSSPFYQKGITFIKHINTVARKNFDKLIFIIYDIGLTERERENVQKMCRCEVREFSFAKFPSYVKQLKTYTFKPLIIQLVVREYPFVMWMDPTIRFTTSDLQPLFDRAIQYGVLVTRFDGSIAQRTHPNTFKFLGETPCTFKNEAELQGGYQVIYASRFVQTYYLKPLVSCALSFGCMEPDVNSIRFLQCGRHGDVYHDCHRFDQSVVGILMHRLYHEDIEHHLVKTDFLYINKPGWCAKMKYKCL